MDDSKISPSILPYHILSKWHSQNIRNLSTTQNPKSSQRMSRMYMPNSRWLRFPYSRERPLLNSRL